MLSLSIEESIAGVQALPAKASKACTPDYLNHALGIGRQWT